MDKNEDVVTMELLVVVVDTTVGLSTLGRSDTFPMKKCMDGIETFGNSHLTMSSTNMLGIIGCHFSGNRFLHPSEESIDYVSEAKQSDGRYELFSGIDISLKKEMMKLVDASEPTTHVNDGQMLDFPLAGALTRALCYVNRMEKSMKAGTKLKSRILVVSNGGESASQYMTFMNVFFTCQKHAVVLDSCIVGQDSSLLQQGSDITGGIYLKVPQPEGLLEYLLWVFLPSPERRKTLVLPPPARIDYRAACFCHRQLVEIGYVCSVCLSIFCKFSPICTTCQTVFKIPAALQQSKAKKRRIPPPMPAGLR